MVSDSIHHNRSIKNALKEFFNAVRLLDFQITFVFISTAILTIISYYFSSRRFFRLNLAQYFESDQFIQLYEYVYWFIADCVTYFLIPLSIIYLVLKKPFREFGLGIGDWKFGLKITAVFVSIMIPIVWIVSASPDFQAVYPHASIVKTSWKLFLIYEIMFFFYFTGWEFIWRGYMLFGLEKKLGASVAILIQMIPFVILHEGKPILETLGSILAAIALGALALRTRSFWYCVLTHWSVMLSIDFISTVRTRTGVFGMMPNDVMNIITKLFQ